MPTLSAGNVVHPRLRKDYQKLCLGASHVVVRGSNLGPGRPRLVNLTQHKSVSLVGRGTSVGGALL